MIEPERYELTAGPAYRFELDRRAFFGALGLGFVVVGLVEAQESGGGRRRGGAGNGRPEEISAWLHIGEDGLVTAFSGKAEVGQNTRTALVQGVAEELRIPVASVKLTMADTDLVPYDAGTFGSRSMPDMLPQVRRVAASARELLTEEGARRLGADKANMVASDGWIRDSISGQSLRYAEVVQGQALLRTAKVGAQTALTPPGKWKVLGTPVPKVNGRDFVTGHHKYTSDTKIPGMISGHVLRAPVYGSKLVSAEGPGVVRDGEFAGVAGGLVSAAKVQWSSPEKPSTVSDMTVGEFFKSTAEKREASTRGLIEEGFKAADKRLSGSYQIAYIAHAPLEPRAAVAQWSGGKLTVWTGTQRPFGVKAELAEAFGIPESQIRVIVPDTGSGYGGKHTGEQAIEAARLAKASGKPVKVLWTREEEFRWAYFRPGGVIDVASGFRSDGSMTAWDFHNYNSGNSGLGTLYDVPHQRVHFHRTESPLRQGSYRGLAATANHFAREVHMDEVACGIGMDPLEFRLRNLKDARLRAVLEKVAEKVGWAKGSNKGWGIAGGFEKGGYVATAAQVSVEPGLKNFRLERAVIAFECGAIANPEMLRNQVEGGLVQGLGGALFERVRFENGRVENARFSSYRVPRFLDMPVVESVLINRLDLPSAGAGETPIVGIAPAISNAIYSAIGVRLRNMPLLG
ncbi:MAG: molybdopterin cofactor-binding domain-containing protein [Bryobacteraceae bacterium]|nr:molybdopterin cofactor-binding domain-containing protein [Bryobacteraceae bacterium]